MLLGVNLIVDYVLLMTVGKLLSLPLKRKRLLLGAGVGAIGSLVILLPPMPVWVSIVTEWGEACLMVAAAICPVKQRVYWKAAFLLFVVSFLYGGFMMAAMSLFAAKYIAVRNGAVYVGMSPFVLIGLTLLCYGILRLFDFLWGRGAVRNSRCRVVVRLQGDETELEGVIDTGNTLHEPFSGECVIVADREKFRMLTGSGNGTETENEERDYVTSGCLLRENGAKEKTKQDTGEYPKGMRMVPFTSVGGSGLMPAFRPEMIRIQWENKECQVSAWLALCRRDYLSEGCDVLVPYELIMKGS